MSTISIYTNKYKGKAFAVDIDKKTYLLTAAHVVGTKSSVYVENTKVNVLFKSDTHDLALLSAPIGNGIKSIELADANNYAFTEAYANKLCLPTYNSEFISKAGDSGSPIIIDKKCIAMLVGSSEEKACYITVDKIHKFIQQYQQLSKLPKITISKINSKITSTIASNMPKKTAFCEI